MLGGYGQGLNMKAGKKSSNTRLLKSAQEAGASAVQVAVLTALIALSVIVSLSQVSTGSQTQLALACEELDGDCASIEYGAHDQSGDDTTSSYGEENGCYGGGTIGPACNVKWVYQVCDYVDGEYMCWEVILPVGKGEACGKQFPICVPIGPAPMDGFQ